MSQQRSYYIIVKLYSVTASEKKDRGSDADLGGW